MSVYMLLLKILVINNSIIKNRTIKKPQTILKISKFLSEQVSQTPSTVNPLAKLNKKSVGIAKKNSNPKITKINTKNKKILAFFVSFTLNFIPGQTQSYNL